MFVDELTRLALPDGQWAAHAHLRRDGGWMHACDWADHALLQLIRIE